MAKGSQPLRTQKRAREKAENERNRLLDLWPNANKAVLPRDHA
jgi:hypothetical protein